MKRYFSKTILALLALVPVLAFAQDDQDVKERAEKQERVEKRVRVEKNEKAGKKDVQQIIITRNNAKDEKTVIEIKGDKVLVNGKDVSKDDNVTVRVNSLPNGRDRIMYRGNLNPDFNFEFNNDDFDHDSNISLFTEDANRAMLGVVTDEDEKGAKITSITRESAASKAGLKVGDVITKIGDEDVDDADDVSRAVREHKPGDKVKISILRDGKEQTITAELGKWKGVRLNNLNATIAPAMPMGPEAPFRTFTYNRSGPKLGLSVQDTDDGNGVKVLDVAEESSAAKAGVQKGDVITKINEEEVNTTDEVVEAMRDARDQPSVKLEVQRNGKAQTVDVRIPRKLKTADL